MARFWDDKDGSGKKLTDGRVCLVIEPDDPALPTIRTYGRDKDEVLEKVAHTAETGQAEIHRLRSAVSRTPAAPATPVTPAASRRSPSADELVLATADLSNPAKSAQAVKTLLRGAGVDVDKMKFEEDTRVMADVAQEWERQHPDKLWSDPRNQKLLMDAAVFRFGFRHNMKAESLDEAYSYLLQYGMLFEVPADPAPGVQPDGSQDSRTTVRTATSYRANALRTPAPVVVNKKPRYTRAEIDAMNSRVLREKIETEPGFKDWYDKEFSAMTA